VAEFEFRTGTTGDAQAISTLVRQLSSGFLAEPDGNGADAFWTSVAAPAQADRLASKNHDYQLVFKGRELVGVIGIRDHSHIFHLFVSRPCQGRGLARALWEQMLNRHARQSPGFWTVNASPDAVPVYEKFGFACAGQMQVMSGVMFLPMKLAVPGTAKNPG
jgi:GNAT superfamily N-acetyltransferase